jgi:hypothetical protein
MAESKTKATDASVERYLGAIADEERRRDCQALVTLMTRATGAPPAMWGPSIVGFGSYHYRYESGREGDSCLVGFSSRKPEISLYLAGDFPRRAALLARLGKHKAAKACLYVRRLSDVDAGVLEQLVAAAVAARKERHG